MQQHGYGTVIPERDEADGEKLPLIVERTGIADEPSIKRDRVLLSGIAEDHDGWYDGWAAAEDE